MKLISLVYGILLPYSVLTEIKGGHPVSGNFTNYYPLLTNAWNSSTNVYSQSHNTSTAFNYKRQAVPGNEWNSSNLHYPSENIGPSSLLTALPTFNYNTQTPSGQNLAPFTTLPSASKYENGWNSSQLQNQSGSALFTSPPTALPTFNYNTQTPSGQNLAPFTTLPSASNYGNRWNSSQLQNQSGSALFTSPPTALPTFNYNTQTPSPQNLAPFTTLPSASKYGNGWNSSQLQYQSGSALFTSPPTALPTFNYNTQTASGQNLAPFTTLPSASNYGNRWNSSQLQNQSGSALFTSPPTALPTFNYNTQTPSGQNLASPYGNAWNSSQLQYQSGSALFTSPPTALPTFNYNTQTSSGQNLAPFTTLPSASKYGNGLNSSQLQYQSGSALFTSPPTALPTLNYNTQTPSGQNLAPFTTLPSASNYGNRWNSSQLQNQSGSALFTSPPTALPTFNYNTQTPSGQNLAPFTTLPSASNYGNRWNSSQLQNQSGSALFTSPPTALPTFNYNTQTPSGQNLAPFTTLPSASNYGNGWNSSQLQYQSGSALFTSPPTALPTFNYNTQTSSPQNLAPFTTLPSASKYGNGWNSSQLQYQSGSALFTSPPTALPTFNYNTQTSSPQNLAPFTTLPSASKYGNGWNSSQLQYQSGSALFTSPPTALPTFHYNTQTPSGQNLVPFTSLPASDYNKKMQIANRVYSQLGSAVHPVITSVNYNTPTVLPEIGWNQSSMNLHRKQSENTQALPGLNFNIQTVTNAPIFKDMIVEFLNHGRSNMASGICFTEVPTSTLALGKLNATLPRGNGSNPTMSRIKICCDGYTRNPHSFHKCEPICRDDCPNGICTAPNTCVCLPGNIRDHEDNCVPTCPIGCRNGNCQPNGSCVCKSGFILDPLSKQFCRPYCSKGCGGVGTCVAPETCRCPTNYELSPSGVCQPKCDNCNGTCTAPGVCTCNRGYIRKGNICEPICTKGCFKGTCTAPETCTCKPGLTLDESKANCVPHCDKPCLNGFCDGYNVCSCNPGYILDATEPNVCKAHCPLGCPNGSCTSPNVCICNKGFRKSGIKGQQNCIPSKK